MVKKRKSTTKDGFKHSKDVSLSILATVYEKRCTLAKFLELNGAPRNVFCFSDSSQCTTSPELRDLVITTIVACGTGTKDLLVEKRNISYSKEFTMDDIVDRVVGQGLGNGSASGHILTQGFRNPCVSRPGVTVTKLDCVFPNTMVAYVKSRLWRDLHERIGSDLMMVLLRDFSVFVETKCSSCYFQVSGQPIQSQIVSMEDSSTSVIPLIPACDSCAESQVTGTAGADDNPPPPKKRRVDSVTPHVQVESREVEGNPIKRKHEESFLELDSRKKVKHKVGRKAEKTLLNRNLFFSTGSEKFFEKTHILETASMGIKGARDLVRDVFMGMSSGTAMQEKKCNRLPKRLIPWQNVFQQFIAGHKSCKHSSLLKHHCRIQSRKTEIKELKEVEYSKVYAFCRAVCVQVVPAELWGSKRNMEAFLSNLYRFIALRKRERFSLEEIMRSIKPNDCEFLKVQPSGVHVPASAFLSRKKALSDFYLWFMNSYITPLLKAAFTITEHGVHRNRVFYYRKNVWRNMSKIVMKELTGTLLEPITEEKAQELIASKESLGYSLLRLLPKQSGIRPLVNMSTRTNASSNGKTSLSINQLVDNVFHVLNYERRTFPTRLGAATFGLDDISSKLNSFAARHRDLKETQPLYFVRLDLNQCFDNIDQQKLLEVVQDVLSEDEYIIRRYCVVGMGEGDVVRRQYKKVATPADDCRSFPTFVNDTIANSNLRNSVVVDQVTNFTVEKKDVMDTLKKHILCNIVKSGKSFYRQKCGISQGSVLSPMLCNYYFGHLENNVFEEIMADEDSLLLRLVDDFLLMTYSLEYAKHFLFSMLDGFPEYNCSVKAEKTLVNFEAITSTGEQIRRLPESALMMPWCSLLVNIQTLEVQADYSRYEGRDAMNDSLTVDNVYHPGSSIFKKLKSALSPKCHAIFLDLGLNTQHTVLVNMYQSFLYTAQRFHAHAAQLPKDKQVRHNPEFFMKGLVRVVTNYYSRAVRITGDAIPSDVVYCLFAEAVLSVLRRKPARYAGLLEMVSKETKTFPRNVQEKVKGITSMAVVTEFLKLR